MEEITDFKFNPEEMTELYTLYKSDPEFVRVLKQNANNEFLKNNGGGGEGGDITASQITDATATGRGVLTAPNAAAARTAIGAGTSSLSLGTTATTAKAGNYVPAWSEVTGKPTTFPPAIGTTATTAKAGDYQPTWAQVSGKPTAFAPVAATASVIGGVKTATAPVITITDPVDDENVQAAFDALILALKTAGVLT